MTGDPNYTDQDVFESLDLRQWEVDPENDGRDRERYLESAANDALWYPNADRKIAMPSQGSFANGWPRGAIVHFTAGRSIRGDADAEATMRYGANQGHFYFCISATGRVYQPGLLSRWGSHAGSSSWPGLGSRVSQYLAGIEICNAGSLKQTAKGFEPEWNKPGASANTYFAAEDVRHVAKRDNILSPGVFHKYTAAQEASLIELLLWLQARQPRIFSLDLVLGHDEVSPRRKDDPGGSLSCTMPELRALLKARATAPQVASSQPTPPAAPAEAPASVAMAPAANGAAAAAPRPPQPTDVASSRPLQSSGTTPAEFASGSPLQVGPRFRELLETYRTVTIDFPHLKDITFAQWAHESGYGRSPLSMLHLNFAGMKWRTAMAPFAHQVFYKPPHDPQDTEYCGFKDLTDFVRGYWHRLDIPSLPYANRNGGWREHAGSANTFLDFIGPIWAPEGGDNSPLNNGYIKKVKTVLAKLSDAGLLPSSREPVVMASATRLESASSPLSGFLDAANRDAPDPDQMNDALRRIYVALEQEQTNFEREDVKLLIASLISTQAISRPEGSGADAVSLINTIETAAKPIPPDLLAITHAAERLYDDLLTRSRPLEAKQVERLLKALRNGRAFEWLARICDRLITSGNEQPIVRRFYAQSLVEVGHINAAIQVLENLKRQDLEPPEMAEVIGQLGRAHKQIYVNHARTPADARASGHRYAGHLRDSITYYAAGYDPNRPADTYWHGINLVAMAARAKADGAPVTSPHELDKTAEAIITALEADPKSLSDPWRLATLGDAHLALGRFDKAQTFYRLFSESKGIGAFQLGGAIRQLEEVWHADTASEGHRRSLMTLKAKLAGERHGEYRITAAERRTIRSENFETNFPDGEFLKHSLLRKVVRAGECVAWIKDRHLNGIGSGFLLIGKDLAPCLGDELYLLTNTHVVCDPSWTRGEMPDGALRPAQAHIQFEAVDEGELPVYRLEEKAVWLSPSSEHDACLLKLKEQPRNVRPARIAPADFQPTYGKEEEAGDGTPVAVLGHAGGRELQIGVRGTLVNHQGSIVDIGPRKRNDSDPVYIHYDSPTLGGNSGSPVFDTNTWQVIGLHHAGFDTKEGRAQLRGRGGFHFANEGILIHSVGQAIEQYLTDRRPRPGLLSRIGLSSK
ncbi:MAG: trypsin-like peptidase domain-containing protein [Hyphomicrobiaceae bacterium]